MNGNQRTSRDAQGVKSSVKASALKTLKMRYISLPLSAPCGKGRSLEKYIIKSHFLRFSLTLLKAHTFGLRASSFLTRVNFEVLATGFFH